MKVAEKKNKKTKRIGKVQRTLSLLLALCMLSSAIFIPGGSTVAFAQETETEEGSTDMQDSGDETETGELSIPDEFLTEDTADNAAEDGTSAEDGSSAEDAAEDIFAEDASETTDEDIADEPAEEEEQHEPVQLENQEHGVTITIPYDSIPEGILEENIILEVRDLTVEEEELYEESIESTQNEVIWKKDITLIDGATGEAFQPSDNVEITLNNVELDQEKTLHVHRIEEDLTVTELEAAVSEEEDGTIVFETDHFTVYTVSTGGSQSYSDLVTKLRARASSVQAGDQVVIELDSDVFWGTKDFLHLGNIFGNINIEVIFRSSGSKRSLRRDGTLGTMIFVPSNMTLTLENVKMDGNGGEFFGNGDYSSNEINGGWYNSGVFVIAEGTLNLKSGAELTGAHTKSDTNTHVYTPSGLTTNNVPKFVAPIFVKGGTVNMYEGASIHGNWFTARVTNGGNMYSAGAILVAPGNNSGNRKGTVNIYGGEIHSNKVGWDRNQTEKNIYTTDRNGQVNSKPASGDVMSSGYMTSSRVNHNTQDGNGTAWLGVTKRNDVSDILNGNSDAKDGINLRTPGAGAILVLASNLNIYGGSISYNNGEVGAIGINGVGHMWDDLFVDSGAVDGENQSKRNSLNKGNAFATWGGKYGVLGEGHNEVTGEALRSTFTFTGGYINGNTGFSNGGVYVGRYGTMIMGNENAVNAHNASGPDAASAYANSNAGGIYISGNRSWANFGGAGIGLNSQQDDETKYGSNYQPIDSDGAPKLYMYSGEISGNHSSNKGGGIYIATSEAHLYGGSIKNNRGDSHGGGIYAEVKYTVEFPNLTEITNNTADHNIAGWGDEDDMSTHVGTTYTRDASKIWPNLTPNVIAANSTDANKYSLGYTYGYDGFGLGDSGVGGGGGLWLCPEGQSTFGDMGNLLIHDNYATKAGDDVYKVVASSFKNTGIIEMPSNDALGGKITWFRDGGYVDNNTNYSAPHTWLVMRHDSGVARRTAEVYGFETWQRFGLWNYPDLWAKQEHEFTGQTSWTDAFAIKATYLAGNVERIQNAGIVKLEISGNSSARGGGIGSDARLTFSPSENKYSEDHDLTIKKKFADGAIIPADAEEITFNVYIQDNKKADGSADEGNHKYQLGQITVTKGEDGTWTGTLKGLKSSYYFADINKTIPLFNTTYGDTALNNLTSTPIFENIVIEELGYPEYILHPGLEIKYEGYEDHSYNETLEGTNGTYYQTRLTYSYTWEVENRPSTQYDVSFAKKDSSSMENISGVTMGVYKMNGNELGGLVGDTWVTDGNVHSMELPAGDYALVELATADGYKIADPVLFRVTTKGEILDCEGKLISEAVVTMYDHKEDIEITVTKTWGEGAAEAPVEVTLKYKDKDGNYQKVTNATSGFENPVTLSETNNWKYTWRGSTEHPLDPNLEYTVTEDVEGTNYVPTINPGDDYDVWTEVEEFTNYSKVVLIKSDSENGDKYIAPRADNGTHPSTDGMGLVGILGHKVTYDEGGNPTNIPDEAIWEVWTHPDYTPNGYVLINHATKQKLVTATESGALGLRDLNFVPIVDGGDEFQYANNKLSTADSNVGYSVDAFPNYPDTDFFTIRSDISSANTVIQMYQLRDGKSITVKNDEAEKVDIEVTKEWSEDFTEDETNELEVEVTLFADAAEKESVTLNAGNNWYHKWENLPAGVEYTVEEVIPKDMENIWAEPVIVSQTVGNVRTETEDRLYTFDDAHRKFYYTDQNEDHVYVSDWALCINSNRPDPANPTRSTVEYSVISGATFNDVKPLIDNENWSEDNFMRLKRIIYYWLTELEGSTSSEYWDPLQYVTRNITDNKNYTNFLSNTHATAIAKMHLVSLGISPDESDTYTLEVINGILTGESSGSIDSSNKWSVTDAVINKKLKLIAMETDDVNGAGKTYQNLLTAVIEEGSTTVSFTIKNSKRPTYDLPEAGGTGLFGLSRTATILLCLCAALGAVCLIRYRRRKTGRVL